MKFSMSKRIKATLLASVIGVAGVTTALASSSDHDRARSALQAGEIQPLADILPVVTADGDGRVIEVELERKRGQWVYEFKTIEQNGMVRETKVNAKTGEVLETEYDDDDDDYRKYGDKHHDKDGGKHRAN